jgi:hypothetical protein
MSTDNPTVQTSDLRSLAIRRLHRKREFIEHLAAYLIVNGMLVAIWLIIGLTADFWYPWPLFPIAGWGVGLAFHAWAAFGPSSRPIDEAAVAREIDRLSRE